MSEFHVLHIFPVSFMPRPFVVGRAIGDFEIGQAVRLHKSGGVVIEGRLESMDLHQREPGEFSFVFSEEISGRVEPGDVIYGG
ncbi:hypothetical protein [Nocardia yamanashiensis]|uniref:hypothetical protein n=1 Tax=Nocardia yamanashiensis TaxID=209247 RepID=UPI00082B6F76|nr:hypothetical protein [Nocardia yamanashiensis]